MRPYHESSFPSQQRHRGSTSVSGPSTTSVSPPSTPSLTPATPSLLKSPIPDSPSQQHTFSVPSLTRASISAQSGSSNLAAGVRERESISRASLSHTPSYHQLKEREDKHREKRVAERRRMERFGMTESEGLTGLVKTHPFVIISLLSLIGLSCIVLLEHLHPSPWLAKEPWLFSRPPPKLSDKKLAAFSSSSSGSTHTPPFTSRNPQTCADISRTALEPREKAAIVSLVRETDLQELLPTLQNFESVFNSWARYPYVFISDPASSNNKGFSRSFKQSITKTLPPGASIKWVEVDHSWWSIPPILAANYSKTFDIEEGRDVLRAKMKQQEEGGVMYAGREGYHHMCRFYSGGWARLEGLKEFDWFWRLEPGVRFYCKIPYDPFRFLALNKKVYGFVIATVENMNTIPTLFSTVSKYAKEKGLKMGKGWSDFLVKREKEEETYSGCHFWTNFEIGDLRFFRSARYQSFFDELDHAGGFYTERWGDAPVRALALGHLTEIEQVHYFEDFAYKHDFFMHCPSPDHQVEGVGCECRCPKYTKDALDLDTDWKYSCLPRWKEATEREWKVAG